MLFQAATAVFRAVGVLELNFRIVRDHFDTLGYCQGEIIKAGPPHLQDATNRLRRVYHRARGGEGVWPEMRIGPLVSDQGSMLRPGTLSISNTTA